MNDALRATLGHPIFTIELYGVHDATRVVGLGEKNLLPWMFAQRRDRPGFPFDKVAGPKGKRPTSLAKP